MQDEEKKGIIDRFEGEFAVIEWEDQSKSEIPRKLVPERAQEGDVIIQSKGKYRIDYYETQKRKEEIEKLCRDLWE